MLVYSDQKVTIDDKIGYRGVTVAEIAEVNRHWATEYS
jgi:hypothetical protein